MIFQSQIESTTRNSKQQGIIYMLLAAALILFIALFIKIPVPEQVVENPIVYMKFVSLGESETGGPAMENSSGDGGGDESAQPNAASNNEIVATPSEGSGDHVINKNNSKNTNNAAQVNPQPEKNSGFKKSKKKGTGPLGDGDNDKFGGGGDDDGNKGSPDGQRDKGGKLLPKYRPRQIKQFSFSDKESDKNEIRHLWVILTVDCNGIVNDVKIAPGTTDTEDFPFIKSQIKGKKYYDKRNDCNGPAKWDVDITIKP